MLDDDHPLAAPVETLSEELSIRDIPVQGTDGVRIVFELSEETKSREIRETIYELDGVHLEAFQMPDDETFTVQLAPDSQGIDDKPL